jgi:hypothetical protein
VLMAKTKQAKVSAKTKAARTRNTTTTTSATSFDGVFLFKMMFYLLLGSMWLKITNGSTTSIPVPIGLLIGLIFTTHEHFQIDRKIEYAVMVVAMLFGYFASYGLYINF